MKTVALFGFSVRSRDLIWEIADDPDTEIWSCNWAVRYNPPRIDRLFEIHDLEMLADPKYDLEHWDWLHDFHTFPIFMQEASPEFPSSVTYPKDEVLADVFEFIRRGNPLDGWKRNFYVPCSYVWMAALAIHEGYECIKVYGFEAGAETEFIYQKEGIALVNGIAAGRGIYVDLWKDSKLIRGKLYGYEACQVITRHILEQHRSNYQQQHMDWLGQLNAADGIFRERMKTMNEAAAKKANKARIRKLELKTQEAAEKRDEAMLNTHGASCALQAITHLIEEVDTQDPNLKLVNTMRKVKVE